MPYPFDQIFAADPDNTDMIAKNAPVVVFAPGDETKTPLKLTTLNGLPLENPITVNDRGFGPAFIADLDQVAWEGGGLTGLMASYRGLKDDAVAAAENAEAARIAAESAERNTVAPTGEAIVNALTTDGAAREAVNAAIAAGTTNLALKPDNGTRAVGKGELYLNPKDFGAKGDGAADDTTPLQQWLDAGGIRLADGVFRITQGLTLSGTRRRFYMENSVVVADAPDISMLTVTGDDADIQVIFDGGSKASYGVRTTGSRPKVRNSRLQNFYSATSTARAIECATSTGSQILNNKIRNIVAPGDSTLGNSNGMARAIMVHGVTAATGPTNISGNEIDGVTGEEGDAIAVLFSNSGSSIHLPSQVLIQGNIIRNVSRRFIKVQASDCKVWNNVLEHDGVVPAKPSNAIDYINSSGASIIGNTVGDHPLLTAISVVGEAGRIARNAVVKANTIQLSDAKPNSSIYLNYVETALVEGNSIAGGARSIVVGNSRAILIQSNSHFGGDASAASFSANGTNVDVVMRNNSNMNPARSGYLTNTSTNARSESNFTLGA